MSSRRESRSSLGNRQNDALFEFESFKKKFLLANKHITKLNSTLSVRIEELNGQISMLYVENLRLRASEIALASQLKREREQSRKVLADAEIASQTLAKHFSFLRGTLHRKGEPEITPTPPLPKARRPTNTSEDRTSPPFRIARPPDVPGIFEEEEPDISSTEDPDKQHSPSRKKSKTKPRLSASKLPLPARGQSPSLVPPSAEIHFVDITTVATSFKPRKGSRRQSGLLTVNTDSLSVPRSGSPAFGSPIRLEAGLAEAQEEMAAAQDNVVYDIPARAIDTINIETKKDKRKGKSQEVRETDANNDAPRDKKKAKESTESNNLIKPKTSRGALQPIDRNVEEFADVDNKAVPQRQFLRPPSPDARSSSPIPDAAEGTGREKRVRKSINYTEPKLNTKMRKPDPPPATETIRKKRSSAAAVMSTASYLGAITPTNMNHDSDAEPRSSLEAAQPPLPLQGATGNLIDLDNFPLPRSRPGSAAAMYSPAPSTRPSGSTASESSMTPSSSGNAVHEPPASVAIRKKKSRPQLHVSDDDDSDATNADGEFAAGIANTTDFANVDTGRRKGPPKRSAAAAAAAALEDIRRHSMVV